VITLISLLKVEQANQRRLIELLIGDASGPPPHVRFLKKRSRAPKFEPSPSFFDFSTVITADPALLDAPLLTDQSKLANHGHGKAKGI
jgi:hypothetical protein